MDNQVNYIGAAIFWSYIVAALCFTALIIYTLLENKKTHASSKQNPRRDVTIFSILAAISFTTLSLNMLNVLIQSFNSWSEASRAFETNNVFSEIWRWSLESTLFRDFAEALVQSDARYLWSEAALLTTFAVSTFMSIEGHRSEIPRLWAYFTIGQILPISFTQNLFHIAILQHESTASPRTIPVRSLRLLRYLTAAYCGCLLILPTVAKGVWLMPVVLVTRIMLCLPLLMPNASEAEKSEKSQEVRTKNVKMRQEFTIQIVLSVAACLLIQVYAAFSSGTTFGELFRTVFEHPAVSSLGCDMIISLFSALVWIRGRSHPAEQTSKSEDATKNSRSHQRKGRKQR